MVLGRQMEVIAHNVANATASGFKAETLLLEPVAVDAGAPPAARLRAGCRHGARPRSGPDHRHRQSARSGDRGAGLFHHRDRRGRALRAQRPVPPQRAGRARDRATAIRCSTTAAPRSRCRSMPARSRSPPTARCRAPPASPAGIELVTFADEQRLTQGRRRPLSRRSAAAAGAGGAPGAGRARRLERAADHRDDADDGDACAPIRAPSACSTPITSCSGARSSACSRPPADRPRPTARTAGGTSHEIFEHRCHGHDGPAAPRRRDLQQHRQSHDLRLQAPAAGVPGSALSEPAPDRRGELGHRHGRAGGRADRPRRQAGRASIASTPRAT